MIVLDEFMDQKEKANTEEKIFKPDMNRILRICAAHDTTTLVAPLCTPIKNDDDDEPPSKRICAMTSHAVEVDHYGHVVESGEMVSVPMSMSGSTSSLQGSGAASSWEAAPAPLPAPVLEEATGAGGTGGTGDTGDTDRAFPCVRLHERHE